MRDTRESRLLLVLLVAIAFALITVDIRGGEQSPIDGARSAAASVFGPVESGVSAIVNPVGNAIAAVRASGARHDRMAALERQNAELKQRLGSSAVNRNRAAELDKLLKTAGAGQYRVLAAEVIAIGAAQGFSWTVTIDAGSADGIARDMTVINGQGLVGRVTTVGTSTSTVLLANDPEFTVGTRMEQSMELGFATGQGDRPLRLQLLNGKAEVKKGDRLVTFGSQADRPFVPGVPVGKVSRVGPAAGGLTRTLQVEPFVGFSKLSIVGVVVEGPHSDPRDSVLPPKPQPPAGKQPDTQADTQAEKKKQEGQQPSTEPSAGETPQGGANELDQGGPSPEPGGSSSPEPSSLPGPPGASATAGNRRG